MPHVTCQYRATDKSDDVGERSDWAGSTKTSRRIKEDPFRASQARQNSTVVGWHSQRADSENYFGALAQRETELLCRGPVNVSEVVIAPPAAVWTSDPAAAADDLSKRGREQL